MKFLSAVSKNIVFALVVRLGIIMLSYTLCRILFYAFNYRFFTEVTPGGLLYILWGGLTFDISAILTLNVVFIIFSLIPFQFRHKKFYQKLLFLWFIGTNSMGLLLNCIDIPSYQYTLRRSSSVVFDLLTSEENRNDLFLRAVLDHWYIALIWIVLCAMIWFLYSKVKTELQPIKPWILYFCLNCVVLILGATLTLVGIRGSFIQSDRPINLNHAGKYVGLAKEMSIVLNTPFCIYRTIDKLPLAETHFFTDEAELTRLCDPVKHPKPTAEFRKENVVIIILESFGREYIGTYNKHLDGGTYKGYTPFMDSLITMSTSYWNAFANGRKSIDAMPSILASIPSFYYPYVSSPYADNKINTLASLLGKKGYGTSFFHGAYNGSMGFDSFARLAGFDRYYGKTEYNNDAHSDGVWGIFDEEFLQFFAQTLNKEKEPFFSTIFTLSSHHPYDVPERYKGKFKEGTIPLHKMISYSDYSLKQFFETAHKMPWFNNTVFIITADHASVPCHSEYYNDMGFFQIPMIFYKTGSSNIGIDSIRIVQQIDIMPTVLDYLNFDEPYLAFGNDMFDDSISHYAIAHNNGVNTFVLYMADYMLYTFNNNVTGLYNFKTDRDMKHNVIRQFPDVVKKLEKQMRAVEQQYTRRMINNKLTAQ